ncbi:alpha/beta hydrolase [Catenulispora yoronensis]
MVPIISWRPDVRRVRNRRYGPARRGNRLDVYVSRRRRRSEAPVLVYIHGGGFLIGSKMLGARPLLYRLAAQGWVCISIDYRLLRVGYGDQLADVRAALDWTRANVPAYGGSPEAIFVAGGSAGAHLAAMAAMAPPSEGGAGTEVRGVIGFYGYYGPVGRSEPGAPASPQDCVSPDAPPFLIVHGTLDTLVLRRDARAFADRLRASSAQPVVYAELPGTQHNFDFFQSPRFHAVTDAVVRFAELTLSPTPTTRPTPPTRPTPTTPPTRPTRPTR